jgi:hypothetical protein
MRIWLEFELRSRLEYEEFTAGFHGWETGLRQNGVGIKFRIPLHCTSTTRPVGVEYRRRLNIQGLVRQYTSSCDL